MAKNYETLRQKVRSRPGATERVEAHRQRMLAEIGLHELRRNLKFTQEQLAQELNLTQAAISKFENADDYRLSTLERYIEVLGGHLEINAVFDDADPVPLAVRRAAS